jgi:hypothetical protein
MEYAGGGIGSLWRGVVVAGGVIIEASVVCASIVALSCARTAMDTKGSPADEDSSSQASSATGGAGSADSTGDQADINPKDGLTVSALKARQPPNSGDLIQVQGVLKYAEFCKPCPADVPCAPCGSSLLIAPSVSAGREDTVAFVGELMEGQITVELGRRYSVSGQFMRFALDPSDNYATLIYSNHRALE